MNQKTNIEKYITLAKKGTKNSIKIIMDDLNKNMTITESKIIDFALGEIDTDEGIDTMKYYLFHGSQIQRNYCALYFGRKSEYFIIRQAYDKGLIDAKQAFSR